MTPEEYRKAADLFEQLREHPESEIPTALDAACAGHPDLREHVLLLLEGDRRASARSFLGRTALQDAARLAAKSAAGPLVPGARLGPYTITGRIGAGGMGEVYRARDSRLDRDVAIKVLPSLLARDAEYLARFAREAHVLALLNHPNIAVIHGVEEERALVMELVEGLTLAERISRGPIPWDDAAEIACQVAAALEAAHEKGVVHRDLKPANIKVTPDGRVKVLDFGLAKPGVNDPVSSDPSSLATIFEGARFDRSGAGMILGTAAYMSPEQAKGRVVDRRTDIWAFGVVLYEMLTGRNPFRCENLAETLAAVLKGEPDLDGLAAATRPGDRNPAIVNIIERCLRKDSRRRWQSIGDARIAIEEAMAPGEPAAPERPTEQKTRWFVWAGAGLVAVGLTGVLISAGFWMHRENPLPPAIHFTINSPGNGSFPLLPPLRVAPNGESIAFLAQDPSDGVSRVYLYDLAKGTTRAFNGTEQASDAYWSSDSNSLLLTRSDAVFRMDLHGDSPQPLPFERGYSSWGPDGIVTATRAGLSQFHPESADVQVILQNEPKGTNIFIYPTLIPGSRRMLFNAYNGSPTNGISVRMGSTDGREHEQLFVADNCALYAGTPSGRGYALYLRGFTINAQELDPSSGQLRGEPRPVAGPVDRLVGFPDPGAFSASNNGVLAFRRRGVVREYRLVWYDRSGNRLGTLGGIADYSNPALSPDGNRVAVGIRDPGTAKRDIFVFDVQRGTASRVAFDGSDNLDPVWSPDGQRIAYSSDRRGVRDLYVKNASGVGEPELLFQSPLAKNSEDWSQDGRWLVYNEAVPNNDDDMVVLSLADRKPHDFLRTRFQEDRGKLSPDGKWMAYNSTESGHGDVYIQPFPPTGEKWQISNGGGGEPQWRGDGKELYYTSRSEGRIMAVDIAAKDHAIYAGIPHALFEVALQDQNVRNRFVMTRDGKKFLVVARVNEKPVNSFMVIVNWPSLLRKR